MKKVSVGILLYDPRTFKILIVHPSGKSNKFSKWHIPKGQVDDLSRAHSLEYCLSEGLRELQEETSIQLSPQGKFLYLGESETKNKNIRIFYTQVSEADLKIKLDWENDDFMWVNLNIAKSYLHPAQLIFIDRLQQEIHGQFKN